MITRYLFSFVRSKRFKGWFNAINILGLSLGIAACLFLTHYVVYHLRYDAHIPNVDNIYRINYSRTSEQGDKVEFASACPIIGPSLLKAFPEVESYGRAFRFEGVFSNGDIAFREIDAYWAETNFMNLLGFDLVQGDKSTALDKPNTVVISESAAKRYFGSENPMGRIIDYNKRLKLEVTGVYRDQLPNTHLHAEVLASFPTYAASMPDYVMTGWIYSGFYTYVKLREGTAYEEVQKRIPDFLQSEIGELMAAYKTTFGFKLQPVRDIHLTSHFMHEVQPNGNKTAIDILKIVCWFVLIIAWVNFFNLSTIASFRRIKELGVRKVLGANRRDIVVQLLVESAITNLVAVFVALLLFFNLYPAFTNISGIPFETSPWTRGWFYLIVAIAFAVGTLSAGVSSAAKLSTSSLIDVLKGGGIKFRRKVFGKRLLVLFQLFIAVLLVTGTVVVYSQYRALSQHNLGFEKEKMLVVDAPMVGDTSLVRRFEVFKREVSKISGVAGATFSSVVPGKPNMMNRGGVSIVGRDVDNSKNFRLTDTDTSFFNVYNITLLAGKGFTGNPSLDANIVVLNEFACYHIGFESVQEALGEKIYLEGRECIVGGICYNFYQLSPKEPIEPQIFRVARRFNGYFTLKLNGDYSKEVIEQIQSAYQSVFPGNPFDFFFLDEFYGKQHDDERRFGLVFSLFSVLALFITAMGILGLSAYSVVQRRKEIAIRKVLGAKSISVLLLFVKEYVLLWALAVIIALPIVSKLISSWLAEFAVKTEVSIWMYIIPSVLVLFIAIVTVLVQSRKGMRINPAEGIRYE